MIDAIIAYLHTRHSSAVVCYTCYVVLTRNLSRRTPIDARLAVPERSLAVQFLACFANSVLVPGVRARCHTVFPVPEASLVEFLAALSANALGSCLRGGVWASRNALACDRVPERASVGIRAGPADLRFWSPDRSGWIDFGTGSANVVLAYLWAHLDALLHLHVPEVTSIGGYRALSARLAVFVEDRSVFRTVYTLGVGNLGRALLNALLSVPVIT